MKVLNDGPFDPAGFVFLGRTPEGIRQLIGLGGGSVPAVRIS
jgi:hypothetical protein